MISTWKCDGCGAELKAHEVAATTRTPLVLGWIALNGLEVEFYARLSGKDTGELCRPCLTKAAAEVIGNPSASA